MKRENVGKVLVGTGVGLTLLVLLIRGGKAAPAAPPASLVDQYLARIAAATTIAELNTITAHFTADYPAKLTYDQYYQLYTAYYYRYYQLPG